jgi:hypothetical protein
MNPRITIILLIVVAAASAGITRFYFPAVEYRNTETVKEVVHNDIQTIIKTVQLPNGTKETTETIVDKSVKKESDKKEIVIASKPQWMFDVGARAKVTEIQTIVYDLQVQRRIVGPFFLGGKISTDKSVGVSIGMEF